MVTISSLLLTIFRMKSRGRRQKFKDDSAIIKTLDYAIDAGISTFMCTTFTNVFQIFVILSVIILVSIKTFPFILVFPMLINMRMRLPSWE